MYTYFKIPYLQLENYLLDKDTVKIIPEEVARCFQVVALEKWGNILTIGMVTPNDSKTKELLEARLKVKVMPFKIDIQEWAKAVNDNYLKGE
jgi:hypothetical protein